MERKKEFVFELRRDSLLNTQVINAGTKGGDGSAIRLDEINETTAVFQNNCLTEKFEETTLLTANIYIYIYVCVCVCVCEYVCMCKVGTTV